MSEVFGLLPYDGGWAVATLTTTPQIVYEVPNAKKATVEIGIENTDVANVPKLRIARVSTITPDAYTEPNVPANTYLIENKRDDSDSYPITRSGITLAAKQALVAWADMDGLVIQISGIEEDI